MGVAINAVIGAVTNALMLLYSERVQAVLPWLAGGIAGVGWKQFEMVIYYVLVAIVLSIYSIKHIRILRLGDEVAKLLGHRASGVQRRDCARGQANCSEIQEQIANIK